MPRTDDDFYEDDRPRRRRPRDDEDEDRPARPRRRRDDDELPPPRKKSNVGLVIGILAGVFVLCCGGLAGLGVWAYTRAERAVEQAEERAAAEKAAAQKAAGAAPKDLDGAEQSRKNLTKIGLALHNHNDAQGTLPQNTYDDMQTARNKGKANATGKPLLSWRVHLLPYLEEDRLWRLFKLDEPWDSPNNIKLLNKMPAVYTTPEASKRAGPDRTYYRGFSHTGALFEAPQPPNPPIRLHIPASFPDGTSNTIAIVEAGDPVEWTKPDDLDWSPGRPRPNLGGLNPNLPFVQILLMDGSVAKMRRDVPDRTLRFLIDRQDGQIIPQDWMYR